MNNEKPLNQLIEELKPEEYADFVECMKENFCTINCQNKQHYKMLEQILRQPENKTYFNTLTKGCQIAAMLYVEAYERQQIRNEEVATAMRGILD